MITTAEQIELNRATIIAEEAATELELRRQIGGGDLTGTLAALAHFMRVFLQAGTSFDHLTCIEAEALAGLWDALEPLEPGRGDWVREYHAAGDEDCGDQHHDTWLVIEGQTRASHGCDEDGGV